MIAFSTCWNSSRHNDGEEMIDEILELGFDTIEISHGLSIALLPGIKKAYGDDRRGETAVDLDLLKKVGKYSVVLEK